MQGKTEGSPAQTANATIEHRDGSVSVVPVAPEAIIYDEDGRNPVGVITTSAQDGDTLTQIQPISVDVKKK